MHDVIAPAAEPLFKAVSIIITKQHGMVENRPKTDADWERIRMAGVTLAESVYLLKIPRPIAPPGVKNESEGPEPPELSPEQILSKLKADPVLWNARIEAVRNVGLEAIDVVKRKDVEELWDVGGNLDAACENCHLDYWYPGQRGLLKKLQAKVQEAMRESSDEKPARKKK
jgi:hypothetical protein